MQLKYFGGLRYNLMKIEVEKSSSDRLSKKDLRAKLIAFPNAATFTRITLKRQLDRMGW